MRLLALACAAGAIGIAGCGSSDSSGGTTSAPADTAAAAAPSSSGGTVTIQIKNYAFSPASTTVKVGQTVKWVNGDSVDHNVTGGSLKSDNFGKGASYTFKATKPGTISYVCTIHPYMKATLTVVS